MIDDPGHDANHQAAGCRDGENRRRGVKSQRFRADPDERGGNAASADEPSAPAPVAPARACREAHVRRVDLSALWTGLGVLGLVGGSVVVLTLLGTVLGHGIDAYLHHAPAWSFPLLAAGVLLICGRAWHWLLQDERAMRNEQRPKAD